MGRAIMAGVPVRDDDVDSTAGLHWAAILLRVMAGVFFLRMVAQVLFDVTSTADVSNAALFDQTIHFASFSALLWGAGELADLALKAHHDLRATRILMARLAHRAAQSGEPTNAPGVGEPVSGSR